MARMLRSGTFADAPSRGLSLTELLIGLVIAAMVFMGIYQFTGSILRRSAQSSKADRADQSLARFVAMITTDIEKAGSDPTGEALQAYLLEATCAGLVMFNYGINPEPADPACAVALGEIGILSYIAYDANADGSIDPEEGLDLVTKLPILRAGRGDYVVYQHFDSDADGVKDAVRRIDVADPDNTADDTQETVLKNVIELGFRYFGPDDTGAYGEVTESTRHDDIREVEVTLRVHAGKRDDGYTNPDLPAGSPFRSYHTSLASFRVPLIVRKE